MSTAPRRYVPAPVVAPRQGGLLAVALYPELTDHWENGVEFEPLACGKDRTFTRHDPCVTGGQGVPQGGRTATVSTTDLSPAITSSDANFDASDAGRTITGAGIPAATTILSVQSPTAATLSNDATATGTTAAAIGPEAGYQGDLVVPSGAEGVPLEAADAFTVYAGFKCSLVGRSLVDAQSRAEAALAFGESRAVEYAYWTGSEGNDPHLADAAVADVLGGGTAQDPVCALGLLEGYLAKEYGGTGLIHSPVELASPWSERFVAGSNRRIETHLGTPIAFGGGYSEANTGPDGTAAPAGTYWAYATGAVAIWRGGVSFEPQPTSQAFDRKTNTVELLASRTYVVSHQCVTAAVLVTLCA